MTRRTVPLALGAVLGTGALAPGMASAQAPSGITAKLGGVGPFGVLAGERLTVRGTGTPGQRLVVRVVRGPRKLLVRGLTVRPDGRYAVGLRLRRAGRAAVRVLDPATGARARTRRLRVLTPRAGAGARGPAVRELQRMLAAKGYVVGQRGLLDARTARAVLTFRKVTGMARTTVADEAVFRRLARGGGTFRVRFPGHGRHVEGDISRQVVALIGAGGRVERIYPTSSGAPATPTILGSFRVYRKSPGTNALGMVDAAYFIRGYAIHGYASVPTYNASHGCLRVPVPEARAIFDWVRLGTPVDTYR
jgi:peptidoglycan hydrolase-like protein with peptidoglycan-binding domain